MSSFFTTVKNASLKAKLQGEIALLDRQITARQQKFGIQLYDLLDRIEAKSIMQLPLLLGTQSQEIKQIFDSCQLSVRQFQDERDAKAAEVQHLQVNRERAPPVTTTSEQLKRAGAWVSSNSSEAKLNAEMVLLDRKIKQRKEAFGVEIFAMILVPSSTESSSSAAAGATKAATASPTNSPIGMAKGLIGGVKSGLTNQLSKLSGPEKEIQKCIDMAKSDVGYIESQKTRKQKEIDRLVQGTA